MLLMEAVYIASSWRGTNVTQAINSSLHNQVSYSRSPHAMMNGWQLILKSINASSGPPPVCLLSSHYRPST